MTRGIRIGGRLAAAALLLALPVQAPGAAAQAVTPSSADYRADALSFESLVNQRYAYLDRFAGGTFRLTPALRAEAEAVRDGDSLLRFLEHAVALLGDHHAITGSSFRTSWALVPSYTDLWAIAENGGFAISDVKGESPAAGVIARRDRVIAIGGVPVDRAVAGFWRELGVEQPDRDQQAFAVRILLAGRRDRARRMTLASPGQGARDIELPNLYAYKATIGAREPVSVTRQGRTVRIAFNDSLGDTAAIAAFDKAMAALRPGDSVAIDLTDTGSGGNTTVGRAIMGWFVTEARPYQMHSSPEELRDTGVARQWAEYVLPRDGRHFGGKVVVQVGRWTGSMGEGLAVGFDALGVPVCGTPMAGLLGAIEDVRLERTGAVIKFPTERLSSMRGVPRERFVPHPLGDEACRALQGRG